MKTPVSDHLFGPNLGEKIKTSKDIQKSGPELKHAKNQLLNIKNYKSLPRTRRDPQQTTRHYPQQATRNYHQQAKQYQQQKFRK